MTCAECLRLVAVAPVGDLGTTTAVARHCGTCDDCARLVAGVTTETRDLAASLAATTPGVNAETVARWAVAGVPASSPARRTSRRAGWRRAWHRDVGHGVALGIGMLLGVVALPARLPLPLVRLREAVGLEPAIEARTLLLRCLSPDQALALLRPYVGRRSTLVLRARDEGERVIPMEMRGPRAELDLAELLLRGYDRPDGLAPGAGCRTERVAPAPGAAGASGSR